MKWPALAGHFIFRKVHLCFEVCWLTKTIEVGRYHSWVVKNPVPENFTLLAEDLNGQIMAMKHNFYPIYGVQFHPESIASQEGKKIVNEFIRITEGQNI